MGGYARGTRGTLVKGVALAGCTLGVSSSRERFGDAGGAVGPLSVPPPPL